MSTKHTPAPWANYDGVIRMEDDDENEIATVHKYVAEYEEESKANARLIASAPENFECNKELAKIVRELCAAYSHPLPEASLARSDAAIAKAEGGAA